MRDFEQKKYKGYTIDKFPHPSLAGTYEVHSKNEKFIGRLCTIKECKDAINNEQIKQKMKKDRDKARKKKGLRLK